MGLMRKMPDSCSMWSSVSIRRLASLSLSMPISSILSAHWRALWFCGFNRHYHQCHIPELLPLFSVTVSASISLTFFYPLRPKVLKQGFYVSPTKENATVGLNTFLVILPNICITCNNVHLANCTSSFCGFFMIH